MYFPVLRERSNRKLRLPPAPPKEKRVSTTRNNGRDCWLLNAGDLFLWIAYAVQSDCFDPLYVAASQSQAKG